MKPMTDDEKEVLACLPPEPNTTWPELISLDVYADATKKGKAKAQNTISKLKNKHYIAIYTERVDWGEVQRTRYGVASVAWNQVEELLKDWGRE